MNERSAQTTQDYVSDAKEFSSFLFAISAS